MKRLITSVASICFLMAAYTLFVNAQIAHVPSGTWVASPEQSMSMARAGAAAAPLADGRVLITGGLTGEVDNPSVLRTAEVFGPNGTFNSVSPMLISRTRHAA